MEEKKFSKFFIASLKRTAQNVNPLIRRKNKLLAEIAEMREELCSIQAQIDGYQIPIKEATGGFTTEDLVERVVTETAKFDKDGKPVKMTQYVLKYPDTIVPPEIATPKEVSAISDNTGSPVIAEDDDLPFKETMVDPMPDSVADGEIFIN